MSNNSTIIRNKLPVTKILLSLAISISAGNCMHNRYSYHDYRVNSITNFDEYCVNDITNFHDCFTNSLDEQEESIFGNSGFENDLLNGSTHIDKNNINVKNNEGNNYLLDNLFLQKNNITIIDNTNNNKSPDIKMLNKKHKYLKDDEKDNNYINNIENTKINLNNNNDKLLINNQDNNNDDNKSFNSLVQAIDKTDEEEIVNNQWKHIASYFPKKFTNMDELANICRLYIKVSKHNDEIRKSIASCCSKNYTGFANIKYQIDRDVYAKIMSQLCRCIREISLDHADYKLDQISILIQNTPALKKVFQDWRNNNKLKDEHDSLYKAHSVNEPKYPRLSEKDFLEEMKKISVQYCNEKITKKESNSVL